MGRCRAREQWAFSSKQQDRAGTGGKPVTGAADTVAGDVITQAQGRRNDCGADLASRHQHETIHAACIAAGRLLAQQPASHGPHDLIDEQRRTLSRTGHQGLAGAGRATD